VPYKKFICNVWRVDLKTSPSRKNPELLTCQPYIPAGTTYALASQREARGLSHRAISRTTPCIRWAAASIGMAACSDEAVMLSVRWYVMPRYSNKSEHFEAALANIKVGTWAAWLLGWLGIRGLQEKAFTEGLSQEVRLLACSSKTISVLRKEYSSFFPGLEMQTHYWSLREEIGTHASFGERPRVDGCSEKGRVAHLVYHSHCTSRGGIVSPGHSFNS